MTTTATNITTSSDHRRVLIVFIQFAQQHYSMGLGLILVHHVGAGGFAALPRTGVAACRRHELILAQLR